MATKKTVKDTAATECFTKRESTLVLRVFQKNPSISAQCVATLTVDSDKEIEIDLALTAVRPAAARELAKALIAMAEHVEKGLKVDP